MQSFRKTTFHFGTLSGLSGFAVFVLLHLSGLNPLGRTSWWGAWIPVVFICLASKHVRDKVQDGFITYWQAFRAGVLTAFFGAVLYALLAYVFGRLVFPGLIEMHKQEMLADMETAKMFFSHEFYEQGVENIAKLNMAAIAYNDFTMKMIGGLAVSFITAAIYRRTPLTASND